jgi:outer membrane protein assembly factor BamB
MISWGVWILAAAGPWIAASAGRAAEEWPQWKFDAGHSGNVPARHVAAPLGLLAAFPLSDAVLTAPVLAAGRVMVVDASGTAFAFDAVTLHPLWKHVPEGGPVNCNNVSSPAIAGRYLHYGTMAGQYYVLDAATGKVIRRIDCGEPIFSTPVVHGDRVYFATLGARVYALTPEGKTCWTWDFVRSVLHFQGDRWSGGDWLRHKQGRVTWRDQFCCPIDIAAHGRHLILPIGGRILWLEDAGNEARLAATGEIPAFEGNEQPGLFGLAVDAEETVYVQWHRRDNSGRVEILRRGGGQVHADYVRGTQTAINLPGLMSFSAVSVRGEDVFRCRPQHGLEFCLHAPGVKSPKSLGGYPSIASPILLDDAAVYGGLDGRLYVVPLDGKHSPWSFATAFGRAITAPAAVCDGRVYFGCEDGHLYVLGPGGRAPLPRADLELERVRTPLSGDRAAAENNWYSNYGNLANTNALAQGLKPPLRIDWIRRYEGTVKHLPVCGGGRLYTHTAEGQVFAVEQSTGRLLWRRFYPDVYLSFTAPLYVNERLLLPQAGMKQSQLRCLDAATGKLLWQAPFSGSPSWSRQGPPVVWKNLAIYGFGTGRYAAQGTETPFVFSGKPEPSPDGGEVMSWIYTHDNPYYPKDNRPLLCAWDTTTGKEVWRKDFSDYGRGGNDCGLCLMDGTVYYSTFFGYAAGGDSRSASRGLTAALDPQTGRVLWSTTKHYVTAGCTISGRDGRLYVGGYNRPNAATKDRHVWCLDAHNGSLVWESEPVLSAVNVISLGQRFLFSNASGKDGHVLDRETGKIVSHFNFGYACTRFTLSEPYLLGANMDLIDLADGNKLVWTGPALEPRECLGGVASNGRLFYTAQASGLQTCLSNKD